MSRGVTESCPQGGQGAGRGLRPGLDYGGCPFLSVGIPWWGGGAGQSSTHTEESSDRLYRDEEGAPVLGRTWPEQVSPERQPPLGWSPRQGHRKSLDLLLTKKLTISDTS